MNFIIDKLPLSTRRSAARAGLALTDHDRALASLKDRHKDAAVFVVGNGPSVRIADLDALDGATVFVMNRFHLAYGRTKLRPTYTVCAGQPLLRAHGEEIMERAGGPVFAPHRELEALAPDIDMSAMIPFHLRDEDDLAFTPQPFKGFTDGGSTGFLALQLAAWSGAKTIVLYGFDHTYTVAPTAEQDGDGFRDAGERNHFISGYRQRGQHWRPIDAERSAQAMQTAKDWAEQNAVEIRNATHGGALDVFARTSIAEATKAATRETELFLGG